MLAIVLALVIGVGLGIAIALVRSSRRRAPRRRRSAAVADPDDIALRLSEAVDHLEIGVVIASASGAVVYRNARRTLDARHPRRAGSSTTTSPRS
jgi:hypothetical protein